MSHFKELDRKLKELAALAAQRQAQPTHGGLVLYEALDEHFETQEDYWQAVFAAQPAVLARYNKLKEAGVRTVVLLPDNHRDDMEGADYE